MEWRNLPQLVKGGKNVYGWSTVNATGKIAVPTEALTEYNFKPPCKVILLPGSARSGGFGITTLPILKDSVFSFRLKRYPELTSFQLPEGEVIMIAGKPCCWATLDKDGYITVPLKTLQKFGINTKDRLLSVRGSCFALGFCVRGPLIDEARKHSNLTVLT